MSGTAIEHTLPQWFLDANPPSKRVRKLVDQGRLTKAADEYNIQLTAAQMGMSVAQFKSTYGDMIELERRKTGEAVVYFIARTKDPADGDPIKIGIAQDVSKRLRSLQTSSPEKLHVLGTMEGGKQAEEMLHERFSDLHIRGEWFRMAPALRAYIGRWRRVDQ